MECAGKAAGRTGNSTRSSGARGGHACKEQSRMWICHEASNDITGNCRQQRSVTCVSGIDYPSACPPFSSCPSPLPKLSPSFFQLKHPTPATGNVHEEGRGGIMSVNDAQYSLREQCLFEAGPVQPWIAVTAQKRESHQTTARACARCMHAIAWPPDACVCVRALMCCCCA